jgi:hypothetical protein
VSLFISFDDEDLYRPIAFMASPWEVAFLKVYLIARALYALMSLRYAYATSLRGQTCPAVNKTSGDLIRFAVGAPCRDFITLDNDDADMCISMTKTLTSR